MSLKLGYFPPSTTSGSLAIAHNSDTILLPSSAIAFSATRRPHFLLHPFHQPGPPSQPSPDSSQLLHTPLSFLPNIFFLPDLPSVMAPSQCSPPFPHPRLPRFTIISTGRGPGLIVFEPNPCLLRKRHQVWEAPLSLGSHRKRGAEPSLLDPNLSPPHTTAAFRAGWHRGARARPPHPSAKTRPGAVK